VFVQRYCSVLFLSIVITVQVCAQQDAMPLIHQVVATYKGAKSCHFESVTEIDMISEIHRSWTKSRELFAKDQPDRYTSKPSKVTVRLLSCRTGKIYGEPHQRHGNSFERR
jgi:hypothetical protein